MADVSAWPPCAIHPHMRSGGEGRPCLICDEIRAAVAAESKLWHETLQGKRDMHSDDRVKAVADRVAAEREREPTREWYQKRCDWYSAELDMLRAAIRKEPADDNESS